YVDSLVQGLDPKASVRVATTGDIDLGTGGLISVDTVTVVSGDRVLVRAQTNPEENGIYIASAGTWSRAADMDEWVEIPSAYVWVESGDTLKNTGYVCTSEAGGTLGTTPITWELFSSAGGYTADNGIILSGANFQLDLVSLSTATITSSDSL